MRTPVEGPVQAFFDFSIESLIMIRIMLAAAGVTIVMAVVMAVVLAAIPATLMKMANPARTPIATRQTCDCQEQNNQPG
jgi:hypothetical protein